MSDHDPIGADAPLLAAWHAVARGGDVPFTIPGHKRRADRLSPMLGELLAGDVPLYGGLDEVKLTHERLRDAERRAAALWGADWCRFSVGGSTHGNQALLLGAARPGDTVLVCRTAHRSTLSGLVLAGLRPAWLHTDVDEQYGVPIGVSPQTLLSAIAGHPEAVAVFLVEPSYVGTLSDRVALIDIAHAAGLPVLVDQAWGAHFGFSPEYPPHALALGADGVVLSAHKTLPAYSQACVVLARLERLDRDRLDRGFDATHTTSPAGAILASIDGARAVLAHDGGELLERLCGAVADTRRQLARIAGLRCLEPGQFGPGRFDPAKLVVGVAGTGADGVQVERVMIEAGYPLEMADRDTLVPIVTMTDGPTELGGLVQALGAAVERLRAQPRPQRASAVWRDIGTSALDPRAAFFAEHRGVPADEAAGEVCAEVIAPYPPGIPLLLPGEIVTRGAVDALTALAHDGTRIAYAADPKLRTIQVVA